MPQNEPFTPVTIETAEQSGVSPAVADIMERAHRWALWELERFTAAETNPFLYYLRGANRTIASILGREANPADFSRIISLKKQLRDREAANDAASEEKKAA